MVGRVPFHGVFPEFRNLSHLLTQYGSLTQVKEFSTGSKFKTARNSRSLTLLFVHILFEPFKGAFRHVFQVGPICKTVTFACIDYQLCRHSQRFECMPEFE